MQRESIVLNTQEYVSKEDIVVGVKTKTLSDKEDVSIENIGINNTSKKDSKIELAVGGITKKQEEPIKLGSSKFGKENVDIDVGVVVPIK